MGPYATQGLQWVGFDDSKIIREKSQFILDQDFGGGMIWALDLVIIFSQFLRFRSHFLSN